MTLRWLDDRAVPLLAARVSRIAEFIGALRTCQPVRLVRAALTDSGLIGPGIVTVLLAGCLLAATGNR